MDFTYQHASRTTAEFKIDSISPTPTGSHAASESVSPQGWLLPSPHYHRLMLPVLTPCKWNQTECMVLPGFPTSCWGNSPMFLWVGLGLPFSLLRSIPPYEHPALFKLSFADGCGACFQLVAIVDNAAKGIPVHVFWWTWALTFVPSFLALTTLGVSLLITQLLVFPSINLWQSEWS